MFLLAVVVVSAISVTDVLCDDALMYPEGPVDRRLEKVSFVTTVIGMSVALDVDECQ